MKNGGEMPQRIVTFCNKLNKTKREGGGEGTAYLHQL